jgi:hypothetical protein
VYSGAGFEGSRELIVIQHDARWVSSYAVVRKRLVAEGQRVKAGVQVAEMARLGARDLVHFELRRDGVAPDPLLYLPAR